MECLRALTPLVEQISIDEAFLDVSDLPESGETIARRLQAQIRTELRLPCSLGVAANKLLAKTANDVGKLAARGLGPPNAITVVPPGEEAAFLAPLPLEALWGVGPKTAARLEELGLHTIGDFAPFSERELVRLFGKLGYDLAQRARGIDDRPLVTTHELKSVSQEVTFTRDVTEGAELRRTVQEMSGGVSRRLRESGLYGTTVKLKIRWPDFTTLTRQVTLPEATDLESVIRQAALALLEKVWKRGQPVRLIGVGISGLGPPVRQLSLWESAGRDGSEKERRLQAAVDSLREKYGERVLVKGMPKNHSRKND
jgi:DNA polymerase-4